MGGVHAMMTAAVDKSELALITFSAPYSAAPVFCDGPLSHANDWAAMCGREGSEGQGGAVSDDDIGVRCRTTSQPPAAAIQVSLVCEAQQFTCCNGAARQGRQGLGPISRTGACLPAGVDHRGSEH